MGTYQVHEISCPNCNLTPFQMMEKERELNVPMDEALSGHTNARSHCDGRIDQEQLQINSSPAKGEKPRDMSSRNQECVSRTSGLPANVTVLTQCHGHT